MPGSQRNDERLHLVRRSLNLMYFSAYHLMICVLAVQLGGDRVGAQADHELQRRAR